MGSILQGSISKNIPANSQKINFIYSLLRRKPYYIPRLKNSNSSKIFLLRENFCDIHKNTSKSISIVKRFSSLSTPTFRNVSAEKQDTEDLDKLFKSLLYEIEHKHMVEKAAILKILSILEEKKSIKKIYIEFLIGCCTELLRNESKSERLAVTHRVHTVLRSCSQLNIFNYNDLLRCFIENGDTVNPNQFTQDISPVKPNQLTYELLLESVCKVGNVQQAAEIIDLMKCNRFSLNEVVYNSLIEAYGKSGNYEKALEIQDTMISLGISLTPDTQKALVLAAIYNGRLDDLEQHFTYVTDDESLFTEKNIMDIIKCMAQNNLEHLVPKALKYLPKPVIKKIGMSPFVRSACAELIQMGYPSVAHSVYNLMPFSEDPDELDDIGKDTRSLLRECVIASTPIHILKNIVSELIESRRNVLALEAACKAALQFNKPEIAMELFKMMKKVGKPLRPHYFWPLMVNASQEHGEAGIFNVLACMKSLDITPDFETFILYVLPNVNLTLPETIMTKFQLNGVTVSTAITPMLIALINTHQLSQSIKLCERYEARLDCSSLLHPLLESYLDTGNVKDVYTLLTIMTKRPVDHQKDWIGKFLIALLNKKKWSVSVTPFKSILEPLLQLESKITSLSADIIVKNIYKLNPTTVESKQLCKDVMSMVDNADTRLVDISQSVYKHPNDMNLGELEGHLIELESNNLNTRGILRKLLQKYCQLEHPEKAQKIYEKCENLKIEISPGMKANMLDIHMKSGNIEKSEILWNSLMTPGSKFTLDDHKIIDYASLLAQNGKIDEAFGIIKKFCVTGSLNRMKAIQQNCFRLLTVMSSMGTTKQTEKMLSLLVSLKFCTDSNIMLGPLVRSSINRSDIPGAVKTFTYCVNKYKKTPLKVELLSILANACNDFGEVPVPTSVNSVGRAQSNDTNTQKHNEYKRMFQRVVDMDVKLYGSERSKISLITALAETGLRKPLKRLLLDSTVSINEEELIKQCERFVKENKVSALELLVSCLDGIKCVDQDKIYEIVMEAYNVNGNCTAALEIWKNIQSHNIKPQRKIAERLCSILKYHRVQIPDDILKYAASHENSTTINSSAHL